jgi:3-deoxy-D-manno-octulosonate 8-phosphate phosphatase KdsC-like HAD superfamily phosphatase
MEGLEKIKIIISEVEGILTQGWLPIDELGNNPFKLFYYRDFEAINLLKPHFKVVFISSDNKINYNLLRSKQIPFYHEPKNKKQALLAALKRYSLKPDDAMYIGSSYSDIECMRQIPFSVCPEDAVVDIKEISATILPVYGGDGVFCAVYDLLKQEIRRRIANGSR